MAFHSSVIDGLAKSITPWCILYRFKLHYVLEVAFALHTCPLLEMFLKPLLHNGYQVLCSADISQISNWDPFNDIFSLWNNQEAMFEE